MAYVEAHAGLRDHLKTKKVARLLGVPKVQVIGHLLCLWWWCQEYAQDGDLSGFDAADIADAAEWEGEPETFVNALLNCGAKGGAGFLHNDPDSGALLVNDWYQYGGKLFVQREQAAERMRNYRARNANKQDSYADVTRNDTVTVTHVTPIDKTREEEIRKDNNKPSPVVVVDDSARYRHTCDLIHQNGFGMMTPLMADEVHAMIAEYPDEWIDRAFEVAVKANKRRLDYALGVLENWRRDGFDPKKAKAAPVATPNGKVTGFSLAELTGGA
jgi:DnaD/phage-associated family protein